ncbi:hypothetical protein ASPZODRAFT_153732 [Penicilliopsis zonata CBS 506.65]|uniref:Uncharacterized protein n=1 Tax=Penicilliopsis zonata CBS 506.65 TaxID=1073090 RepID=A0A1L9SAP1_9EURO|nr:hypothetical protein ASPZODRAFT_153732 [Penicilliopsis zonata CBS 506.65]OJJ44252.1 hypothetical protein ASPZODRAFT_153732 [Penicilliopsis zonata CBS 506.65]
MADLAAVAGGARSQNGSSRAAQGPVPVQSHPAAGSGVRTPTDIMRQRRDREARRKAEQEARDREQQELAHAQYAAGVAGDPSAQRRPATSRGPPGAPAPLRQNPPASRRPDFQQQHQQQLPLPPQQQPPPRPMPAGVSSNPQLPGPSVAKQPQPQPSQQARFQQQQQQQQQAPPGGLGQQPGGVPKQSAPAEAESSSSSQQTAQQPQPLRRTGFPHAFERWETLSSHWEGLTGYWIRKLESNNEALERDPLNQQMARQITDLSAAGANLFHAVVELQRLRASSERKFQRWFFDTRAEQERAKELQGEMEKQLQSERQARAEALTASQKADSDKTRAEDLLREMRRELQISKEEARRAWEELGRREQEERDRTTSLRNGEPTLVGGVQVVPMIQGLPSRQNTTTTSRGGAPAAAVDPIESQQPQQYYDHRMSSPAGTDPFVEETHSTATTHRDDMSRYDRHHQQPSPPATTTTADPRGGFYQHAGTDIYAGTPTSQPDDRSYGPSIPDSEVGDAEYASSYRRDGQHGQHSRQPLAYAPAPLSEGGSDEYDDGADESDLPHHHHPATTSAGANVDYSGSGWGAGWEAMTPRHRHPTRLSDVLEEDEPSRTSPSRRI